MNLPGDSPSLPDQVDHSGPARSRPVWMEWGSLLRPSQWIKNMFVLAPVLFSGRFKEPAALLSALAAFIAFSLLASGVYAVNDVIDRRADAAHPLKRTRPIASGRISPGPAVAAALALWVAGLFVGWAINPLVAGVGVVYITLNLAYSLRLKHVVIVDVFAIAAFFVLRLLAGSVAVSVQPSIWLLTCGSLLALYLGFAKRRHELIELGAGSVSHRTVLAEYSPAFLDQISAVLLAVTIVAYMMYTLSPAKVTAYGHALAFSTVFVLFGVFRYLYLVHQRLQGSPTEALLADRPLMVDVLVWAVYCGIVVLNG